MRYGEDETVAELSSFQNAYQRWLRVRGPAAELSRRVEADQNAAEVERALAWDKEAGIDAIESVVAVDDADGEENGHVFGNAGFRNAERGGDGTYRQRLLHQLVQDEPARQAGDRGELAWNR